MVKIVLPFFKNKKVIAECMNVSLQAPNWLTYDFPPDVREKLNARWGTDWKGQAQKW
jgi:hypothetical protein